MSSASHAQTAPLRRATDRLEHCHTALVTTTQVDNEADDVIEAVPLRSAQHDPSFLTHLIAVAERCPQTRTLRRATPQDAMAAYRAAQAKGHVAGVGITALRNIRI